MVIKLAATLRKPSTPDDGTYYDPHTVTLYTVETLTPSRPGGTEAPYRHATIETGRARVICVAGPAADNLAAWLSSEVELDLTEPPDEELIIGTQLGEVAEFGG